MMHSVSSTYTFERSDMSAAHAIINMLGLHNMPRSTLAIYHWLIGGNKKTIKPPSSFIMLSLSFKRGFGYTITYIRIAF